MPILLTRSSSEQVIPLFMSSDIMQLRTADW